MPDLITRRDFLGRTAAGTGLAAGAGAAPPADWRRTHLLRACLAGPSREEIESMARVGANVIQCNVNAWVTEDRGGTGMMGGDPVGDFVEIVHRLGAKAK